MRVLSLFDGISCGHLALTRAKIPVTEYLAAEIDPFAESISVKNYPGCRAKRIGDVKQIVSDSLGDVDLLIGGSPCQDLSLGSKYKRGITGERSSLFWEYVRILEEVKPKYLLLENVRMSKENQAIISKALRVEPILINSALVSAQNRRRLYWTNIPNVTQPEDKGIILSDILEPSTEPKYLAGQQLQDKYIGGKRLNPAYNSQANTVHLGDKFGTVCSGTHGYSCGYVPCPSGAGSRRLTPIEFGRLQNLPDNYTQLAGISDTQRYKMVGNCWNVDTVAHIFKHLKENRL